MLDIRRRTGYLVLAVTVGHLTLISAQVTTRSGVKVLEAVTSGFFGEIQRGVAWVVGGVSGAWFGYLDLRGLRGENERLKRELSAVQVRLQEQRAQALRGQRLELLMGLQRATPARTIAAEVIAGDASPWFRTVTINRGTSDGLRADLAVLSPAGVVGRIVGQPARHTARVQLLVDRNAGAGALLERSRAGGVVIGDDGRVTLRLEYVSNLADVAPGDVVVTSGLDRIYPKGFVIGQVVAVEKGTGLYKSIRVRAAVDFSAIEEVLVVLDPPPSATASEGHE